MVKKEAGPYWPHLLKEKTKQHWLTVDFNRWMDEDDTDDEEGNHNQWKDKYDTGDEEGQNTHSEELE